MITHSTEFPYTVVCPRCKAAITAHCLMPLTHGSEWLEQPHIERVIAADAWRKMIGVFGGEIGAELGLI